MFDAHRTTRTGCQRRMLPAPRLETRLLIGRDDVFIASQCGPFPSSAIQIQDTAGFLGELGIAGKDPAAMPPGLQRIGAQPAPQGDAADLCHDAAGEYLTMQFGDGEARQWHIGVTGNSHAKRLTSTTTLGGKAGCAPASRLFLKARHAVIEETVAPFADDLARCIESRGDKIVAEPLGRQQDDLRADDVSIR